MLAPPRHPDPVPASHSRQPLPLARSMASSTTSSRPRPPLTSTQPTAHHPNTVRDPSPPMQHKRSSRPPSSSSVAQPPSARPPSAQDDHTQRRRTPEEGQQLHQGQDKQQQHKEGEKKATASRAKLTDQWGEPPQQIRRDNCYLQRGDLLGEGGFARVYLCTEPDGITYKALKVIDKQQLKSTKTKAKLFAEIKIHQAMQHPNIIAFEHCFEDDGNVYMQLELCSNGSLLDLLRLRRRYSEPEARFYLTQLVGACDYMHANSVIHRDLKLGNLMLDENMDLRVGDFGLAALVKFPGERKKTICGTPNYIAPEILFDQKAGHSFEVDIWSIGVILYTLLIGRPPFQTKDVKNIYRKIRDNAYTFPSDHSLSPESLDLIGWILNPSPTDRPTLGEILAHPWFTCGPFPSRIPAERAASGKSEDARAMVEEWGYMTKRQARENFRRVKRRAGIVEVEEQEQRQQERVFQDVVEQPHPQPAPTRSATAAAAKVPRSPAAHLVSQALPAVAEAVEEEDDAPAEGGAASRRPTRLVRRDEEREAKGRVEKEVRQATAPESPISELLRSARKPLMVSPSSRAPPPHAAAFPPISTATTAGHGATRTEQLRRAEGPIQQPAFSRARTASSSAAGGKGKEVERERPMEKENEAALARARPRRGPETAAPPPPYSAAGSTAAPAEPRQRQTSSSSSSSATPAASSGSSSSSSLYLQTYAHFDLFLSCTSASDLQRALGTLSRSSAAAAAAELPDEPDTPKVFLTSWIDYTHKYGTAYSLTDGTAGVYFNDSTSMVLSPDKQHFDYITNKRSNVYVRKNYAMSSCAAAGSEIDRKAYLLRYFEDYMAKTLRRDVEWAWEDTGRRKNMDFLVKYYRMKNAIVFKLSNDVLQFNFYDHTKLILTSTGLHLTFISPSFALTSVSLPYLFRLAASLGHYSTHPPRSAEEEERLKEVRGWVEKVEYCREVLKQLGERRKEKEKEREEAKERRAREKDGEGQAAEGMGLRA